MYILPSGFLPSAEKAVSSRLPRIISPRVHGFIDYAYAAFFLGFGVACLRNNKRAAAAAFGTGALLLVESLLTDYPLGADPVISFQTHGKIDAAFASSSWLIPKALGFSGTPAAHVFEGSAAVAGTVTALTDFDG